MDRTVPNTGNEDIALYMRTYYSLLRSSRDVQIRALIEAHKRINSALHVGANEADFDISAFVYSTLRLPEPIIDHVQLVVLGQSESVFARHGFSNVMVWESVSAPARRRKSVWDGGQCLAMFIASRSDIDDIVPKLTAFQIERDKLQVLLSQPRIERILQLAAGRGGTLLENEIEEISDVSALSIDDLTKIQGIWRDKTVGRLLDIIEKPRSLSVRLLAGSFVEYKRATRRWWNRIEEVLPSINFFERPIYFVSSNTHSVANLISGHAQSIESELVAHLSESGDDELQQEYAGIQSGAVKSNYNNFLYYLLKKYEADSPPVETERRIAREEAVGCTRIESRAVFDLDAQIIELNKLNVDRLDERIQMPDLEKLDQSEAIIINIDYPLGMAAYQILSEIGRNVADIRGIFIMGKAATLNGRIGDVMIPNVVHDEHSQNTYLYNNHFAAADVDPFLRHGTVLDNQKAITVSGTFLQNHTYMSVFYHEGYTDLEMEAGPYLSCIYEIVRPRRYPRNEIVTLHHAGFPIGILHYASDTPFSKGMNLGTRNLSYEGMDSTYATTIAILRAIFTEELSASSKKKVAI